TVASVSDAGDAITFKSAPSCPGSAAGTGKAVSLVLSDAVQVTRRGTGDSIMEVQRITISATAPIVPSSSLAQGFFQIVWQHDGATAVTRCIEYGASAADVQAAIDAAVLRAVADATGAVSGMDLNQNNGVTAASDAGHIQVTMEGDGSAAWGYGYVYTLTFRGQPGVSTVLGNVGQVRVAALGAAGACEDVGSQETVLTGATASTTNGSAVLTVNAAAVAALRPGDRIRLSGSTPASRIYTVTSV
ncbi:hypothetical protein JKP88DRAFT_146139, partial [Tribonema minus]